ncbi:hypothetical protein F7725_010467 [Dissostichus mawsoni]|uniref:Uncharacterized protein n=1 Tax=Dissostichus mawsoni TaxID=36200 RepID=A0A7J5XQ49_DISMA|nr:hypothetical protein F7725_010467 [Dissostichus mawsoni]
MTQTDLRVEEPEITAVSPKDPVRPGDSVTLQCSILSDSENKKRPEEQNLCCFKVASHQRNGVEVHEQNPGGPSTKKCVNSFYKTCDCDVATCEGIISGNGSELTTTDTFLPKIIYTDGRRQEECEKLLTGLTTVLWPHVERYYSDM